MTRRSSTGPRPRGPVLIGIVLVLVGGLILLRNAGIIRIEWGAIWAIVLVGLGLALLVGALMPRGATEASSASVARDGTTRLELDLGVGAGLFRIEGGARGLVDVESSGDDISTSVDRRSGVARVRVRQRADWFPFGWRGPTSWTVRVADDVPTSLVLNAGAGEFWVDLSPLRIVDARISAGAAQVEVVLPRPTGELRMSVSAGAAQVVAHVPPGVEARFTTSGLMSVTGRNETPGYATARDRVLVAVSGGAASLRIV